MAKDLYKQKLIRVTEADMKMLKEKSQKQKMSESAYIRMLIRDKLIDNKEIREHLLNLTFEINKIGTNINQVAKNCNMGLFYEKDMEKLLEYMKQIKLLVLEVVKYCN